MSKQRGREIFFPKHMLVSSTVMIIIPGSLKTRHYSHNHYTLFFMMPLKCRGENMWTSYGRCTDSDSRLVVREGFTEKTRITKSEE